MRCTVVSLRYRLVVGEWGRGSLVSMGVTVNAQLIAKRKRFMVAIEQIQSRGGTR
jgi:hypothetical protein